jgi:hypothetical protein
MCIIIIVIIIFIIIACSRCKQCFFLVKFLKFLIYKFVNVAWVCYQFLWSSIRQFDILEKKKK